MKKIDLIILCGGKGKRLRSITGPIPKILCNINNKPFIHYLLNNITRYNFNRIILSTGYQSSMIEKWLRKSKFYEKVEIINEKKPLGTGGAIKFASQGSEFDKIIINGDTIIDINFKEFINDSKYSDLIIGVKKVKKKYIKQSGFIEFDNKKNIISFNEKVNPLNNDSGYVNAGLYFFSKKIINMIPDTHPLSIEYDFFPEIIKNKNIDKKAYEYNGPFIDFGTPSGFNKAEIFLRNYNFN